MPNNSLLDFGEIGRFALGVQNLRQQQIQNDISMAHLGMQQDRADTYQQQVDQQNQQLKQQTMMNLYKISDDDMVRRTPGAKAQIMAQIGAIAGAPALNMDNIQVGENTYRDYIGGLASGDADKVMEGAKGIALTGTPEDTQKLINAFSGLQARQEQIQKIQQYREMNAGKVEALQNNNALVSYAKPLYTAASSLLRDDLRGTDTPQFKQLQELYAKNPSDKLLSSSNPLIKNKSAFAQTLDGNFGKRALMFDQEASRLSDQVTQDQKMLTDSEHGIALPDGVTPAMLRARVETNSTLLGATRDMQAWYESPLDKDKLAAAKAAYKTVESRRMDMEALEKTTNADRIKMQQDALTFRMDESQRKQAQSDALAEAQRQYYALPTNQQNMQTASKISQSVKQSTGMEVKPEDIFKNPNAPQNVTNVNLSQEKAEASTVGTAFGKQYAEIQSADVDSRAKMAKYDRMGQLLSGIKTGKLVPAMTNIQSIADSLGISVDKTLGAKQAFQALSGEVALTLRNPSGGAGMPGALSDRDLNFLVGMTPDLAKTHEGNEMIIDTARKLAKRDQEVAKMARDYRKTHGQFDEGFYDQLAAYSEKNPLFSGKTAPPSKAVVSQNRQQTNLTQGGNVMPQASGGAVLKSLPQGSKQVGTYQGKPVFEDGTGKRWIGD